MANGGEAGPDRRGRKTPRGPVPEHRQYVRYIEQYCADSLSEAVSEAEGWALDVLGNASEAEPVCYPSRVWIARQLCRDLRGARGAVAEGDAHRAAWYAVRVGELIADAHHLGYLDAPPAPPFPEAPAPSPDDPAPR